MLTFLKNLCGKAALSALELYRTRKIQEWRDGAADGFNGAVRSTGQAVFGIFSGIMLAALSAGGLILLPLAVVANKFSACFDPEKAACGITRELLHEAFMILLVTGCAYLLVPLFLVFVFTREGRLRKMVKADEMERKIRGR